MKKPLLIRRVYGHSMEPNITEGRLVFASGWLKPKVGELAIAQSGGREVIKRLEAENGVWYLSSDAPNHGRFAEVAPKYILGRVFLVL